MFSTLRNPGYRNLFAAQVAALLGTGLATVALSLLAFELAGLRAAGTSGLMIWPANDPEVLAHTHPELLPGDPHLAEVHDPEGATAHAHPFVIDDRHRRWPPTKTG